MLSLADKTKWVYSVSNRLKVYICIPLLLCALSANAQRPDTVIDKAIYRAYFSYEYKEPLFVAYILWHGGGKCSRASFHFMNDSKLNCATNKDYEGSGYDRGHLAPAEDFAGDCSKDSLTFMYYNAIPQTVNLNRGKWKTWETKIRKESQYDSLLIICGGFFSQQSKRLSGGAAVPDTCWKIVQSLSQKDSAGRFVILHSLIFTNATPATFFEAAIGYIEKRLGYKLPLAY